MRCFVIYLCRYLSSSALSPPENGIITNHPLNNNNNDNKWWWTIECSKVAFFVVSDEVNCLSICWLPLSLLLMPMPFEFYFLFEYTFIQFIFYLFFSLSSAGPKKTTTVSSHRRHRWWCRCVWPSFSLNFVYIRSGVHGNCHTTNRLYANFYSNSLHRYIMSRCFWQNVVRLYVTSSSIHHHHEFMMMGRKAKKCAQC